ncbi:ankyrin repeat domain-containing protein [Candidatus Dependentiae bacterium]|nr:ankyrin repeat domain-containing protein [Candidatus Dependentiae bacterium]
MVNRLLILWSFSFVFSIFSMEEQPISEIPESRLQQLPREVLLNIITRSFIVNPDVTVAQNLESLSVQKANLARSNKYFAQFIRDFSEDIYKAMGKALANKFDENKLAEGVRPNIKNRRKNSLKILIYAGAVLKNLDFINVALREWPDIFELMLRIGNKSEDLKLFNINRLLEKIIELDLIDYAKLLIQSGNIDTNYRSKSKIKDTLLHIAIHKKSLELVKLLLDVGANVNLINAFKSTPLMIAAMHESPEIVKLLLEKKHKANVNLQNKLGWTALIYSIKANAAIDQKTERSIARDPQLKKQIVQDLLAADADVNLKDKDGRTALDHTNDVDEIDEIKQILINAGAKTGKEL